MAQLPCIGLSSPLTNPPFGSCAICFHYSVFWIQIHTKRAYEDYRATVLPSTRPLTKQLVDSWCQAANRNTQRNINKILVLNGQKRQPRLYIWIFDVNPISPEPKKWDVIKPPDLHGVETKIDMWKVPAAQWRSLYLPWWSSFQTPGRGPVVSRAPLADVTSKICCNIKNTRRLYSMYHQM